MKIAWFDSTESIISFCIQGAIILLLLGLTLFTIFKAIKRKGATFTIFIMFMISAFAFVFQLDYLFIMSVLLGASMNFFAFISNIGDVRKFFANPFHRSSTKKTTGVQKITNSKDIFLEIQRAVEDLSSKKVGALITLEKNTNLNDICKNGITIGAPFTKELISTIFYPGTRLHDGAVIVKDGIITSASVFYTPTTKPFAIKYGSRHRAAIGISEISDAITIVVSEETGFVSIAQEGGIHQVEADALAKTLANYF